MPQLPENSWDSMQANGYTSTVNGSKSEVKGDYMMNGINYKDITLGSPILVSPITETTCDSIQVDGNDETPTGEFKPIDSTDSSAIDSCLFQVIPAASEQLIKAPFDYISSLPSKGVRENLIKALNVWVGATPDEVEVVTSIIADVHNLSLMLDDVEDNSPLRRAMPATHSVFGMPQTVNSATYQIVDVISRASGMRNAAALEAVVEEMKSLQLGQGLDLYWTHNVSAPSVEEYIQMVDGKTGGLFRMVSRLMAAQSATPDKIGDLTRLMTLFGRFFQIRDDYANLVLDQYTKAKGPCEDLDEGKWSFILVHAFDNAEPAVRNLLCSTLMQRRVAGLALSGHKELIIKLLQDTGSLEYTVQVLRKLQAELMDELLAVEAHTGKSNPDIRHMVEALKV